MLIGTLMWVYYKQISNCCRPVLTYWLPDWRHQRLTDCWSCTAFCCDSFSLLWQLCTVGHGIFLYGRCKQLFASKWNNAYFSDIYSTTVFEWLSLLHLLLKSCDFLNTATRWGCGGIFKYNFATNFLLSLTVKEFWKSVNIWWNYGQEFGVLFFWLTLYSYSLWVINFLPALCINCNIVDTRRKYVSIALESETDVNSWI